MIETLEGPLRISDADSHILEPPDVWTSRVPKRFVDLAPRVERSPRTGYSQWRIGENWIWPVGFFGSAGFDQYPPLNPTEYDQVQTSTYDATERLKRMDEYGIDVQLLYPNIIGFQAPLLVEIGHDFALACTRAYNDFAHEWASADPNRLLPMAMLPYWDVPASIAEMERCIGKGFRGVLFANKFERVGLPAFTDPYWDPVYAAAQEMDIPINYHIGFSTEEAKSLNEDQISSNRAKAAEDAEASREGRTRWSGTLLITQADVIGQLLLSGVCERFPRLNFVSVETGFGHMPFYLETLDWHWKAYGPPTAALLPSEIFKRQCYGTFWFERTTLSQLAEYPDNFMYSTDYPHSTGGAPGPASPGVRAAEYVAKAFADVDPAVARKAVWGNASRLYKLDR